MRANGRAMPVGGVQAQARIDPRTSGSPRELVSKVQRMWAISAMAKIVCEQGLESATVAQIVARAGISRSKFYEFFENRDACFRATFEEAVALAAARAIPAYEAECKWVDRVRAGLRALLVFLEEEPELARVCVVHALAADPVPQAGRTEVLQALIAVVDEGRREAASPAQLSSFVAECAVGGALAAIHARLLQSSTEPSTALLNSLMYVVTLPYLGSRVALRELARPVSRAPLPSAGANGDFAPLESLDIRLTYRTLRVLAAIAAAPGSSNRQVADAAGVHDDGQISKLLMRLQRVGLVQNTGQGHARGGSNAWVLTSKGARVERASRSLNGHTDR
jgi:TetR/AcrR family transcriptional regulator